MEWTASVPVAATSHVLALKPPNNPEHNNEGNEDDNSEDVDENDKKISIAQSTRLARFCADLIIREEWQFGRMSVGIF